MIINNNYPNSDPDIVRRLARIEEALSLQTQGIEEMKIDLSALESAAAAETDIITALEKFISDAFTSIADNASNQAAVQAIADKMIANKTRLAALLVQGTPVATGAPVPPSVDPGAAPATSAIKVS